MDTHVVLVTDIDVAKEDKKKLELVYPVMKQCTKSPKEHSTLDQELAILMFWKLQVPSI